MSASATMEAFEQLLNESLESATPKEGEVVNGSVLAIAAGQAIIDIGIRKIMWIQRWKQRCKFSCMH